MKTPWDHPLVKQMLWSVLLIGSWPCHKSTPVNPDHDGEGSLLIVFWTVHVQEEAIFIALNFPSWIIPVRLSRTSNCGLGGYVPESLFWMMWLRSNKPEWTHLWTLSFLALQGGPGTPCPIYGIWSLSLTEKLSDVTLADEDANSILNDMPKGQSKAMWQCQWLILVAYFGTNTSGATWWPNFKQIQVVPHGGQNCNWCQIFNQYKLCHWNKFWTIPAEIFTQGLNTLGPLYL